MSDPRNNKNPNPDDARNTQPLPSRLKQKSWEDKANIANVLTSDADDRYAMRTKFAHGGMGDIYEAFDKNCKRVVAMKVMRDQVKSRQNVYRFVVEAQITAQLEHPNIVPIHDLSLDTENRLFYSMKKIKGITLKSILSELRNGNKEYIEKYPLTVLLTIFQNICDAAAYAHSKGIVHRDLKPGNIMIGDYGEVLVLDWGIAKILESSPHRESAAAYSEILKQIAGAVDDQSKEDSIEDVGLIDTCNLPSEYQDFEIIGSGPDVDSAPPEEQAVLPHGASDEAYNTFVGDILGTMGYMSPEQYEGQVRKIDCRSDIFSLGVILYYILALRPPFLPKHPKKLYRGLKEGRILSPAELIRNNSNNGKNEIPKLVHFPGDRGSSSLSAVTMKAMAFRPSNRYDSVAALQDDIRKYQAGFATSAEDAGAVKLLILLIKRQRILAFSIVIIIPLLVGYVFQAMKSERIAHGHKLRAERNAVAAKRESLNAKHQLAQSLIAEGNALATLNKWGRATEKYRNSRDVLNEIGVSTFPARLGLWNATRHSPPVVNSLRGHNSPVLSIAISEDGSRVVSGGSNGELILWDPKTSEVICRFDQAGLESPIVSLAFSQDNVFVLSGHYDGSINYWDVTTGSVGYRLHGHTRWITSLAISASCDIAASASTGESVVLWDLKTRKQIETLVGHQGGATSLAFSPDGRKLLIAADDYSMVLWDIVTGDRIQSFRGNDVIISVVGFGPVSNTVISGGLDGVIRVWNINTGKESYQLNERGSAVLDLQLPKNKQTLVSAHKDFTITVWNIQDKTPRWRYRGSGMDAVAFAFSPDGKFAVANGQNHDLSILAINSPPEVEKLKGHLGPVLCASYSDDAKLAVSGGWDKSIRLWDLATRNPIKVLNGHQRAVTAVTFLGTNRHVFSTSLDGTMRFWDLITGNNQELDPEEGAIVHAAVSPDHRFALIGHRTGKVVLWNINSKRVQRVLVSEGKPPRTLAFSTNSAAAMAVTGDGTVIVWSVPGFFRIQTLSVDNLRTAAISADGQRIVTGSRTGEIKVWQVISGDLIVETDTGSSSEVTSIIFSPDGEYLYSGSRNSRIQIADATSGKTIGDFREHDKSITTIVMSHDGTSLITGSRDKMLNLWNFATPAIYGAFHGQLKNAFTKGVPNPMDPEMFGIVGEWYLFRGLSGWAIPFLEEAERRGNADVLLSLARCYWQEAKFNVADTVLEKILVQGRGEDVNITLLRQALTEKTDRRKK